MPSIKFHKDKILDKIDKEIDGITHRLDGNPNISSNDAVNIAGRQDALHHLKVQINSINVESILLVPSDSDIIGVPQYLNTDDKFLNAAYYEAILIKDSPRGFDGDISGSPLGEGGKEEAMKEMMAYIKSLAK